MSMRTTVEINDEQRARLLELAARRRLKGFSVLVQEALDSYLAKASGGPEPASVVRRYRGSLGRADAERFRGVAEKLRSSWK